MREWAKREIELACKRENPDRKEGEFDYGCACYISALKAFNSLLDDEHSGMSIVFTKNILNRLIDGKCLTPIEDTDDIWRYAFDREDGTKIYQCIRMTSLFKEVHPNGEISYDDVSRVISVDINNGSTWSNGTVSKIINEMYPISMPYFATDKQYKVYCEEFLTDPKNGDYDTIGVIACVTPDGERVDINRYFKDDDNGMIEIDEYEYSERAFWSKMREETEKAKQPEFSTKHMNIPVLQKEE